MICSLSVNVNQETPKDNILTSNIPKPLNPVGASEMINLHGVWRQSRSDAKGNKVQ